ncbi:MAG: choice-of-anchor D domain-containing protein [Solirubrobacteraceae bacterium]
MIIPLNATALNGPHAVVGPLQTDFGNLAIGKSASQTVTVANDGDAPMQIQQAFMVTGTPSVFPITADGCSGQVVNQGSSCQFTVRFEPTAAGFREGSVIIIINNTPAPVTPIGFVGTGVRSPNGTATITGKQAGASTPPATRSALRAGPSTPTDGCATGKPSAAPQRRAIRRVTAMSAPSSHVG